MATEAELKALGEQVHPEGLRPGPVQGPALARPRPGPGRRRTLPGGPSRPSARRSSTASTTTSTSTPPSPPSPTSNWPSATGCGRSSRGSTPSRCGRFRPPRGGNCSKTSRTSWSSSTASTKAARTTTATTVTTAKPRLLTVYTQDTFTDLCRGPHVESTRDLDPQGVQGDTGHRVVLAGRREEQDALKRFHATGWATDGRRSEGAPGPPRRGRPAGPPQARPRARAVHQQPAASAAGFPIWLPKGATVRRILETFITDYERADGYLHVYTPDLAKKDLYKSSAATGTTTRTNMFPPMKISDDEELVLRPMNCPHHILIYDSRSRGATATCRSASPNSAPCTGTSGPGVVGGLSRVRCMTLNDAHLFCPPRTRSKSRVLRPYCELVKRAYADLGITDYSLPPVEAGRERQVRQERRDVGHSSERLLREALTENGLCVRRGRGRGGVLRPEGGHPGEGRDGPGGDAIDRSSSTRTCRSSSSSTYKDADDTEKRPVHDPSRGRSPRWSG